MFLNRMWILLRKKRRLYLWIKSNTVCHKISVFADKDWGRKAFEYLCMFHVICHQIPCPIQQRGIVFPFAICVLVEAFLVGFARFRKASSWLPKPYPYKTGLQLPTSLGSPAPVCNSDKPFYASSVKSPLLIQAAHMLSLFPTVLYDSFLSLEEVILKYQPSLLDLSSLSVRIPWDSQSGPWRGQSLLSKKPGFQTCLLQ